MELKTLHGMHGLSIPGGVMTATTYPDSFNMWSSSPGGRGHYCYEVHFIDGESESVRGKGLMYGNFMP